MKKFAELYTALDQTTKTNSKIEALVAYFSQAPEDDILWTVALLTGRRPKRILKSSELTAWSQEMSQLPAWIFFESYLVVGDLAETITLVLPAPIKTSDHTLSGIMALFKALEQFTEEERKETIVGLWLEMTSAERLVFTKLITGSFRVGVSQQLVIKALAKRYEIPETNVAHRLMGDWDPYHTTIQKLLVEENLGDDISKPYPFYLAYQLDDIDVLGDLSQWQVERKFDGIRGQIILRQGKMFVWSRGEDLMTEKFPEFEPLKYSFPEGTVVDGEILPFKGEVPMAFHIMQTRIGRKNVSKKYLEEAPLAIMCYDILEMDGEDVRELPLKKRREILENLIKQAIEREPKLQSILKLSPIFTCTTQEELAQLRLESRDLMCEGLMLKYKDSPYEAGRKRGKWWKWKIDPLTIDAVLIYAQRGHGRRANLYTDYTFGVWDGEEIVPFAKAYSGLTDKELVEVDNWIKKNTSEKFGPVRSVKPELVFEIAFEDINHSPRHKSGVAVRFPRIARWRKDKNIQEANSKDDLLALINSRKL